MSSKSINIENAAEYIVGYNQKVPLLNGELVRYVNFDNAASTPTLKPVLEKLNEFMLWYSSIHRGTGFKSQLSTHYFEESRKTVARFFKGRDGENHVVFVKNSTEAINKLAHRVSLPEDSVILVSKMEHHSNDLPWRFRKKVVHIGIDDLGRLDIEDLKNKLLEYKNRIGIIAITGASNVTGFINDIHYIAGLAHENGAKIMIDAAQLAPHRSIDIKPVGHPEHLDYVAFSAHKIYAPFGIGALIADSGSFTEGDPDIVGGGTVAMVSEDHAYWTDAPEKEEAGTPNVVGAVALAKALEIISEIGMNHIAGHEARLTRYALHYLKKIPGIVFYGSLDEDEVHNRLGVISFNIRNLPHALVGAILNYEGGVGVRNGCFCAHPYIKCLLGVSPDESRVMEQQILSHDRSSIPGAVRMSFGMYNDEKEIDRFIDILKRITSGKYTGNYVLDKETGEYHPKGFEMDFSKFYSI